MRNNSIKNIFEDIFPYVRFVVDRGPVHADVDVPGAGLQARGVAGGVLEGGKNGAKFSNIFSLICHIFYDHVSFTHICM